MIKRIIGLAVLTAGIANPTLAVPVNSTSATGSFLSWRDCTTPEQAFCAGALGSSNPAFNAGTGDRLITGAFDNSSESSSFGPGGTIGGSTFSIDVNNAGLGITAALSANAGNEGRVGATGGGYQGYVYTGATATTKTLDVSMTYSKSAGFTENAGEGTALAQVGLVRTTTNSVIVDPDFEFIGMDTAFSLLDQVNTLNTATLEGLFLSDDTAAASGATVTGSLNILLNPGDVFFVVGAFQTVANQGGFGTFNVHSSFTNTSDLQTVPGPLSAAVFAFGLLSLLSRRRTC